MNGRITSKQRHAILIGTLFAMLVLAGCLTVTMEIEVGEDGELDLEMTQVLDEEGVAEYEELLGMSIEEFLEVSDADSLSEMLAEDFDDSWVVVDTEDTIHDDGSLELWIHAQAHADDVEDITVTVTEDRVEYVATAWFETHDEIEEIDEDIEFTVLVHMPGDITETNGNQIDDRTVEWTYAEHTNLTEFSATSERASDANSPLPGFGFAVAILAILLAVGMVTRNNFA